MIAHGPAPYHFAPDNEAAVANVRAYRTSTGGKRFVALVRIRGFKPTSKSFSAKRGALDWAAARERELRAQRERGGARQDVGEISIRQLIERFLADPGTRQRRYFLDLERLVAEWAAEYGDLKVRAFGRYQIARFRDALVAGRSPATVNRYMSAMRRCWNWGMEHGYVLDAAMWPKKLMLEEPKAREVMATAAQLGPVFAACDAHSAPLGSLVRFLVGTGARLSDALAVRWRDVDLEAGDVAIRGQKTQRALCVAMLAPAVEALERAAAVKHLSGRVFWQFKDRRAPGWQWLKARKSFPEEFRTMRLHDCRHLCASLLAASGATDVELAAQLGHSTLTMVKRYAHLRGGHRGEGHRKVDEAFGKHRSGKHSA